MRIVFAAGAMALAGMTLPVAAIGQKSSEAADASTIVVTGEFREDWQDGSELEAKGLKTLEKARAGLIKASAALVTAQNRRDSSTARANNAATEFRRLVVQPMEGADSATAAAWAKRVDDAASEWARFDGRGDKGRNDMTKALKAQAKAQAQVAKAEATVESGRRMKAEAVRRSLLASGS